MTTILLIDRLVTVRPPQTPNNGNIWQWWQRSYFRFNYDDNKKYGYLPSIIATLMGQLNPTTNPTKLNTNNTILTNNLTIRCCIGLITPRAHFNKVLGWISSAGIVKAPITGAGWNPHTSQHNLLWTKLIYKSNYYIIFFSNWICRFRYLFFCSMRKPNPNTCYSFLLLKTFISVILPEVRLHVFYHSWKWFFCVHYIRYH